MGANPCKYRFSRLPRRRLDVFLAAIGVLNNTKGVEVLRIEYDSSMGSVDSDDNLAGIDISAGDLILAVTADPYAFHLEEYKRDSRRFNSIEDLVVALKSRMEEEK